MTFALRPIRIQTAAAHFPRPLFGSRFPHFGMTILQSIPYFIPRRLHLSRDVQNISKNIIQSPCDANDALIKAISAGKLDDVKLALKNGANPNHKVNECDYALHTAILMDNLDIVRALLKAGADVNLCNPAWNITPLHKAAFQGNAAIVLELLKYKPNMHIRSVHCGLLPLEEAILSGNFDCCHVLLNEETKNQLHLFNRQRGSTPYLEAFKSKNQNIVELFQIAQQSPGSSTSSENTLAQNTPLHEAAALGLTDRVQELLDQGSDPTLLNNRALSPLDVAQLQLITHRIDSKIEDKETRKAMLQLDRTISILDVAMRIWGKKRTQEVGASPH